MFTFVCNASKQGRQAPAEDASAPKFRLHVETVATVAKMLQRFQRFHCATETSVRSFNDYFRLQTENIFATFAGCMKPLAVAKWLKRLHATVAHYATAR
jgi:hypothetical protein